ncbi:MAG TPA: MGMT family protein [Chloroflexota bacterium]|nr:MGMT family protein [Chloroflexota bacterium]
MSTESDHILYARIYDIVRQVPEGSVATYGEIAALVGDCDARTVGYALNDLPGSRQSEVPWQRVINSQGGISTRGEEQRRLLEAEGIEFDPKGRVPLARFRWPRPEQDAAPEVEEPSQLRLF